MKHVLGEGYPHQMIDSTDCVYLYRYANEANLKTVRFKWPKDIEKKRCRLVLEIVS
jgi:hypothetical protein